MSKIIKEEIIEQLAEIKNPRSAIVTCDKEEHTIYYYCSNKDFAIMLIELFYQYHDLANIAEKAIQLFYTTEEEEKIQEMKNENILLRSIK